MRRDAHMPALQIIREFLDAFAPAELAEDWDNTGLLAGDPAATVARVMTCLTVTPRSAREAVAKGADLVVSHHPLPFRPIQRLVTDTTPGRLLWHLITHHVAIYSPHTAYDSTFGGINQRLAEGLGLVDIEPLVPRVGMPPGAGAGRMGRVSPAVTLGAMAVRLKQFLALAHMNFVGALDAQVERVAVACGAGGAFLSNAKEAGCDLLVVGEANLHTCLEAEATQVALLLPGHFASERFAVEQLARLLAAEFPDLEVWASAEESDPIGWL
ncbi:MAG: Nif3-like dinuclear metal center hexameric protein [Pirellulaceae bacterium]